MADGTVVNCLSVIGGGPRVGSVTTHLGMFPEEELEALRFVAGRILKFWKEH